MTASLDTETTGILEFVANGVEAEAEKIAECAAVVELGVTVGADPADALLRLIDRGETQGSLRLERREASLTRHQSELLTALTRRAAAAIKAVRSNADAASLAYVDPLTGLANRRQLDLDLERECAAARRYRRPVALALVDIDDFKRMNDEHGHPAGDAALRLVGGKVAKSVRRTDCAYRHGGDEFAVLLPDTEAKDAWMFAERARLAVRGAQWRGLTVSIGVAEASEAPSPERFLALADAALYDAKRRGRDRVAS